MEFNKLPSDLPRFLLGHVKGHGWWRQWRRRSWQRWRRYAGVHIGWQGNNSGHSWTSVARADRQLVLVGHSGSAQTWRWELVTGVGNWPQSGVVFWQTILQKQSRLRLKFSGFYKCTMRNSKRNVHFRQFTFDLFRGTLKLFWSSDLNCALLESDLCRPAGGLLEAGGGNSLGTGGGGELNWDMGLMGGGG